MRPIAIIQHHRHDGPGFFATWCQQAGLPTQVLRMDQGDALPTGLHAHSGLCLLGGPMSANDTLPYYPALYALVAQALREGVPVIGHCLGGQMLARALGATVQAAPCVEIGWSTLQAHDTTLAQEWFGPGPHYRLFQWHGECFTLPPGAQALLNGRLCPQQAFVAQGRHLGMQFHIEVDTAKVRQWLQTDQAEIQAQATSPGVQTPSSILSHLEQDISASQALAAWAYHRWGQAL